MKLTPGKIIIILIIGFIVFVWVGNYFTHTYIKAEFNSLDPLPAKMPVYFKGFRLGNSDKVTNSKDFKKTYLNIVLNQRGLHLPNNITVQIKSQGKNFDYVELIYPAAPSLKFIKNGDIVKGESNMSFNAISANNQQKLDMLSKKGEGLLSSATETSDSLTELFNLITDVITENRENIKDTTTNIKNSTVDLAVTTSNLKDLTIKINKGIPQKSVNNSVNNIEQTTENLSVTTMNLIPITQNLNTTTNNLSKVIPQISTLFNGLNTAVCHINEILCGIKKTLQKRFGGARIIFGKPISQ